MSTEDLTLWISKLGEGDEQAAQVIWEAYFEKLVRYARRKLDDILVNDAGAGGH